MQADKTNKNKNKPDELKCTYDTTFSRENLENPKTLAKKLSYNNGLHSENQYCLAAYKKVPDCKLYHTRFGP